MPPVKNFSSANSQRQKKLIYLLSFLSLCLSIGYIVVYRIQYVFTDIIGLIVIGFLVNLTNILFILFCLADDQKKQKYANRKIAFVSILWAIYTLALIIVLIFLFNSIINGYLHEYYRKYLLLNRIEFSLVTCSIIIHFINGVTFYTYMTSKSGEEKKKCRGRCGSFLRIVSIGQYKTQLYYKEKDSHSSVGGGCVSFICALAFTFLSYSVIIDTFNAEETLISPPTYENMNEIDNKFT